MVDTPRRLVLLRHAKSDWPPVPDEDRPLSARGRRDARAAGEALRAVGAVPDLVLCSTARRTRQTWRLAAKAGGFDCPVRAEPRAYAASPEALLAVVRELPPHVGTAVLVCHNPAVEDLAQALTGEELTFRTSAFAVLGVAATWAELMPGEAQLLAFEVPRG